MSADIKSFDPDATNRKLDEEIARIDLEHQRQQNIGAASLECADDLERWAKTFDFWKDGEGATRLRELIAWLRAHYKENR